MASQGDLNPLIRATTTTTPSKLPFFAENDSDGAPGRRRRQAAVYGDELAETHKNIARSAQDACENAMLGPCGGSAGLLVRANFASQRVALNCKANG